MPAPENTVSEEAHGWLYDAITAKLGTTEGVMGENGPSGGSRIGFVNPLDGKVYLARLELVPEEA